MRKLFIATLLIVSGFLARAQKDLDDVQASFSKAKYTEAKEKIDKILADPKGEKNANAWYWKGKVYTALAQQDSTNSLGFDARQQAFDAYRKYQELDPKNILMTLEQNAGLFQLYDMYYNQGIKSYNAKDYTTAYDRLKGAIGVEEYIAGKKFTYNNFTFPAVDTQLVNLVASSAYLAKKEDESIPYFERLADLKLKGKEYRDIYALLVQYYQKKGDQQKADKYLTMGKELFPDNSYWLSMEIGDVGDDKEKRMARYDELIKKYPDNFDLAMDYAIDLFNYTYSNDKKPADYKVRQDKLRAALDKALTMNPNSATANFVMTQHLTNQIYDMDDQVRFIKTNTTPDQAKKKQLNAQIDRLYDEQYKYAQKAYDLYSADTNLKATDKVNYRKVTNALVDYYRRKKQNDKVAMLEQKLKQM